MGFDSVQTLGRGRGLRPVCCIGVKIGCCMRLGFCTPHKSCPGLQDPLCLGGASTCLYRRLLKHTPLCCHVFNVTCVDACLHLCL